MIEFDPYDRLLEAVRDSEPYPQGYTLLRNTISRETSRQYHARLLEHEDDIFDQSKSRRRILFWETVTGDQNSWRATTVTDRKGLAEHLIQHQRDPKCRHIFIESRNSRAPLNCSASMLKMLLTYHQIDPSFLDCIFSFGDSDDPVDASLAQFFSDDTLTPHSRLPDLPFLGRSGKQIRHSLLLRSVEPAPEATEPWSIRQAAAYYSFDVETGHTVFITVKGNDSLQKRIMEDTVDLPVFRAGIGGDIAAAFESSLATLLIYLSWCERDLRWYIREKEVRIRAALVMIKTIPVDGYLTGNHATLAHTPTGNSALAGHQKQGFINSIRSRARALVTGQSRAAGSTLEKATDTQSLGQGLAPYHVLNRLNYKDYQTLASLADKLEEVTLVVRLNLRVLRDIVEKYENLRDSDEIGGQCREGLTKSDKFEEQPRQFMTKPISHFVVQVQAIIRRLETRETQLVSLQARLKQGKDLYENLLQYRSFQAAQMVAEVGMGSSISMQHIAHRTQRETTSMHIITVVTLVFLPATFLSSFFQSGILQWRNSQDFSGPWLLHKEALGLFIGITIPMTFVTLFVWFWVYLRGRSLVKKRARTGLPGSAW